MATIITIDNQKGGVGKSTTTAYFGYLLAQDSKKALIIDTDFQGDTGDILERSFDDFDQKKLTGSFSEAFKTGNLKSAINRVTENLDYIKPGLVDEINGLASTIPSKSRYTIFIDIVAAVRPDYDYILIDAAPGTSELVPANCIVASDYVLAPVQTKYAAVKNTLHFIADLQVLKKQQNSKVELIGVLPSLMDAHNPDELEILTEFRDQLQNFMTDTIIYPRRRIQRIFKDGIHDIKGDHWSQDALKMYRAALAEILKRIETIEKKENV